MPFLLNAHGGWCCGIMHMYVFPTRPKVDMKTGYYGGAEAAGVEKFKEQLHKYDEGEAWTEKHPVTDRAYPIEVPVALEIVLVDKQLEAWREIVEAHGFREVYQFRNPNSGNWCHVMYRDPPKRRNK